MPGHHSPMHSSRWGTSKTRSADYITQHTYLTVSASSGARSWRSRVHSYFVPYLAVNLCETAASRRTCRNTHLIGLIDLIRSSASPTLDIYCRSRCHSSTRPQSLSEVCMPHAATWSYYLRGWNAPRVIPPHAKCTHSLMLCILHVGLWPSRSLVVLHLHLSSKGVSPGTKINHFGLVRHEPRY